MITVAYLHDGTSVYDEMLLKHLVEKRRVHFLTFWPEPRFVPEKAKTTVMREPLRQLASKEWMEGILMYAFFPLRFLMIRLQLRRLKPDIVIGCMATKYGFYTTIAKTRPTIVIVWGSDVLMTQKRFFFFRFLAKHALKKADLVLLDSKVQEEAAVQLGCDPNRILKFPWFDTKDIVPRKPRLQIRQELKWQSNTIICCTRRHEPIYRVQDLIQAAPEVIQKRPCVRFLILGEGSMTRALIQKARELKIDQYVKFAGAVSRQQVIDYLNASDVYISTSISDGTSASLLEAMTLALPVVVTAIPGNKEWIQDAHNGFLTPTQDPRTLAEKILQLVESAETTKRIGQNARKTVQQQVNWQENMQAFDDLIQKLAASPELSP